MTDLVPTTTKVGAVFSDNTEIYTFIANVAITAGAAVYVIASGAGAGKLALADGSAAGTANPAGIALNGAGAGQAVNVLKHGHVEGMGVSGLNYFIPVYLSDTDAGILGDVAGTVSKIVGRVVPMSNSDLTKVLFVDLVWA